MAIKSAILTVAILAARVYGQNHLSSYTPSGGSQYSYLGCYVDAATDRKLANQLAFSGTIESCINSCFTNGGNPGTWSYAGLENGNECWCANALTGAGTHRADGECSTACSQNSGEDCGGANRISVYTNVSPEPDPGPVDTSGPHIPNDIGSGYGFLDCYTADPTTHAAVFGNAAGATTYYSPISLEDCAKTCAGLGYQYLAMTYYDQCTCGDSLTAGMAVATTCNLICDASNAPANEYCGGINYANQVYQQGILLSPAQRSVAASRSSFYSSKSAHNSAYSSSKSAASLSIASARSAYSSSRTSRLSRQSAATAYSTSIQNAASTSKSAFQSSRSSFKSSFSAQRTSLRSAQSQSTSDRLYTQSSLNNANDNSRATSRASASTINYSHSSSLAAGNAAKSASKFSSSVTRNARSTSISSARSASSVTSAQRASAKSVYAASVSSSKSVLSAAAASSHSAARSSYASSLAAHMSAYSAAHPHIKA